jgi:hypothetical protein
MLTAVGVLFSIARHAAASRMEASDLADLDAAPAAQPT